MRYSSNSKGVEALGIAAIGTAVAALAVAVSATDLRTAAELMPRMLAVVGLMGCSTLTSWVWLVLKRDRDVVGRLAPVPVSPRERARIRLGRISRFGA